MPGPDPGATAPGSVHGSGVRGPPASVAGAGADHCWLIRFRRIRAQAPDGPMGSCSPEDILASSNTTHFQWVEGSSPSSPTTKPYSRKELQAGGFLYLRKVYRPYLWPEQRIKVLKRARFLHLPSLVLHKN